MKLKKYFKGLCKELDEQLQTRSEQLAEMQSACADAIHQRDEAVHKFRDEKALSTSLKQSLDEMHKAFEMMKEDYKKLRGPATTELLETQKKLADMTRLRDEQYKNVLVLTAENKELKTKMADIQAGKVDAFPPTDLLVERDQALEKCTRLENTVRQERDELKAKLTELASNHSRLIALVRERDGITPGPAIAQIMVEKLKAARDDARKPEPKRPAKKKATKNDTA